MKNFNFATRLYLGFTVLMVLMVTVALTGYWGLTTQRNSVSDMLRSEVQLNDLASEARYYLLSLRRFEKDSLINADDAEAVTSYVAKWEKSFARLQASLNKAIKISSGDEAKSLENIKASAVEYGDGFRSVATQLGQSITTAQAGNSAMSKFKSASRGMEADLGDLLDITQVRAEGVVVKLGNESDKVGLALMIQGAVALLLAVVISWSIGKSVQTPLNASQRTATQIATAKDLTIAMPDAGKNEIGNMLAAFSSLFSNLRGLIRKARNSADEVSDKANEMQHLSEALTSASSKQADTSASVAAAVEQLTVSISVVAENAKGVSETSQMAMSQADEGERLASLAADDIGRISTTLEAAGVSMDALNERSDEIGDIVRVIKDIADQTNLLALNAAIEAARAGEQGRGFAVVADEVRKLAERTTRATTDISNKISTVHGDTVEANSRMKQALDQIKVSVASARELAMAMNVIREGSRAAVGALAEVAAAVREQRVASTQIARDMERIAQISSETHESASSVSTLARYLGESSNELKVQIGQYTVD